MLCWCNRCADDKQWLYSISPCTCLILVGAPSATALLQHGIPFLSSLTLFVIVSSATLVLLYSPAHKQLTHSVWPPSNRPRLRFMLNAWLHVRVINFCIVLHCITLKSRVMDHKMWPIVICDSNLIYISDYCRVYCFVRRSKNGILRNPVLGWTFLS